MPRCGDNFCTVELTPDGSGIRIKCQPRTVRTFGGLPVLRCISLWKNHRPGLRRYLAVIFAYAGNEAGGQCRVSREVLGTAAGIGRGQAKNYNRRIRELGLIEVVGRTPGGCIIYRIPNRMGQAEYAAALACLAEIEAELTCCPDEPATMVRPQRPADGRAFWRWPKDDLPFLIATRDDLGPLDVEAWLIIDRATRRDRRHGFTAGPDVLGAELGVSRRRPYRVLAKLRAIGRIERVANPRGRAAAWRTVERVTAEDVGHCRRWIETARGSIDANGAVWIEAAGNAGDEGAD